MLHAVYETALAAFRAATGKATRHSARPVIAAGLEARVKVDRIAADLGVPKGTVSSWAFRLKLTDPGRLAANLGAHARPRTASLPRRSAAPEDGLRDHSGDPVPTDGHHAAGTSP